MSSFGAGIDVCCSRLYDQLEGVFSVHCNNLAYCEVAQYNLSFMLSRRIIETTDHPKKNMTRVFISYAAPDRALAIELAHALSNVGLVPTYDLDLSAGDAIHATLETALQSAARVIVLWSEASVSSRWVLSEAESAAKAKKLVPVRISDCSIPLGFSSIFCEGYDAFIKNLPRLSAAWQYQSADAKFIVVVDDDPISRDFVASILQTEGYVVGSFGNSQDALEEMVRNPPDLAVVDYVMPKIDGIELIRKLRSFGAEYPIVVLTSKSTTDDEVLGLVSGGDDYVRKPLRVQTFLARIRAHLRKSARKAALP